uniref:Uncharacterized protein n=1 Tax=Panagrolaimus superbus TaxID=310955 RepID=A0A914YJK8_9BILA
MANGQIGQSEPDHGKDQDGGQAGTFCQTTDNQSASQTGKGGLKRRKQQFRQGARHGELLVSSGEHAVEQDLVETANQGIASGKGQ